MFAGLPPLLLWVEAKPGTFTLEEPRVDQLCVCFRCLYPFAFSSPSCSVVGFERSIVRVRLGNLLQWSVQDSFAGEL